MRRLVIAGGVSLVIVVTTVLLVTFFDSGPVRLLVFIFLQYPAMFAGYVAGGEASVHAVGIVAWGLWSVVIYAALWQAAARKGR